LKLGETHGVQFLKGITCNNIGEPLGMGLWEGVPLRVLIWMTRPVENIRRVWYYGYHNDDPKQMFRSSLPIGEYSRMPRRASGHRLLQMNGEYLTGKRGGPVRMIVPEAYGFKSVKWLQRVVLTNHFGANDTYERWNNDVDSPMKSFARFADVPESARAGERVEFPVWRKSVNRVGQVQWSFLRKDAAAWSDDQTLGRSVGKMRISCQRPRLGWRIAWRKASRRAAQLRSEDGSSVPVAASLYDGPLGCRAAPLECGTYTLRCRSIDHNGIAQPMPRPFAKSGRVDIHEVTLVVA
jgi:DMSO/TMAO reductase YedYZ molybdopterin-dependent catalytic subunit